MGFQQKGPAMIARFICLLLIALAVSQSLIAQPKPADAAPPPAASAFSLTIYSTADPGLFDPQQFAQDAAAGNNGMKLPGYGVVRDSRKIDLLAGENTIKFTDVAS